MTTLTSGPACISLNDPHHGCGTGDPCVNYDSHSTVGCSNGACVALQCYAGWGDCDGLPGCETDPRYPRAADAADTRVTLARNARTDNASMLALRY